MQHGRGGRPPWPPAGQAVVAVAVVAVAVKPAQAPPLQAGDCAEVVVLPDPGASAAAATPAAMPVRGVVVGVEAASGQPGDGGGMVSLLGAAGDGGRDRGGGRGGPGGAGADCAGAVRTVAGLDGTGVHGGGVDGRGMNRHSSFRPAGPTGSAASAPDPALVSRLRLQVAEGLTARLRADEQAGRPPLSDADCGHVNSDLSRTVSGGRYTVTATITWQVTWSGGGATGTEPALTSTASVQVAVVESAAVNTRR